MTNKHIKRYLIILLLLCVVTALMGSLLNFNLSESNFPFAILTMFTVPSLCAVVALIASSGFRCFRLKFVEIVANVIIVIAFEVLMVILALLFCAEIMTGTTIKHLIVLGVCSLVAIIPTLAAYNICKKTGKSDATEEKKSGRVWKLLLYATLISSTLLVLLIFLSADKYYGYLPHFINFEIFPWGLPGVQALYILLSIAIFGIMSLASWLWRNTKTVSILSILLLAPLLLFGVLVFLLMGFHNSMLHTTYCHQNDNYNYYEGDDDYVIEGVDDVWVVDDDDLEAANEYFNKKYYDHAENIYFEKNYVTPNEKILSLTARKDMAAEYDSLRAAIMFASEVMDLSEFPVLPIGFRLQSSYDFYQYDKYASEYVKWGPGMKTFRQLLSYANAKQGKNYEGMEHLVRQYGKLIKLIVPEEKFRANGWWQTTNQLLVAYDDLSVDNQNFRRVFSIMNEDYQSNNYPDFYYEKLLRFVKDKKQQAFICEKDINETIFSGVENIKKGDINQWSLVWAYSFWGRRYDENPENIKELVATLRYLRDELYAKKAPKIKNNMNVPPIEPYLESEIRPREKIYPWKKYTDRMTYVSTNDYGDYTYFITEHNGETIWFASFDGYGEDYFNRGDVLDVTWYKGISFSGGDESVYFENWLDDVKLIKEGNVSKFIRIYNGYPPFQYSKDISIDMRIILRDKLLEYMINSNNPQIKEVIKSWQEFEGDDRGLQIYVTDEHDIKVIDDRETIFGYGYSFFYDVDGNSIIIVIDLIYNNEEDKFYDDIEFDRG